MGFKIQRVIYCAADSGVEYADKSVEPIATGGGAALGKMTRGGSPIPGRLRRALGLVLVAGLCVAAVTVYQDAPDLPRSARAPSLAPSPATTASTGGPSRIPHVHDCQRSPCVRSLRSTSKPPPKGPGTTQPGILLMASLLRDGSFDIAEIVKLTDATSSVRLSPPNLTLAGDRFANAKPVATQVQVSADNQPVLVPGGRVSRQIDIALLQPAKRIELRLHPERHHHSQHPIAGRPRPPPPSVRWSKVSPGTFPSWPWSAEAQCSTSSAQLGRVE